MKKNTGILGILGILVLVVFVSGCTSSNNNYSNYTNHYMSFQYPAGWNVENDSVGGLIFTMVHRISMINGSLLYHMVILGAM